MSPADTPARTGVLLFGGRRVPRSLRRLPTVRVTGRDDVEGPIEGRIDAATAAARRVVVVGAAADLATVLTRLLRTERLDVEVAHADGWRAARRALSGTARRVPLIRDDTGRVLATAAEWLPAADADAIHGEAIVDDTVLFDGDATAVRIEPVGAMPGLRARAGGGRWVTGRAAQLGTTGARVVRDGVPGPRVVRRSTFYRHTEGWLRVH